MRLESYRSRRARWFVILTLAGVSLAPACTSNTDDGGGRPCTAIGCSNGLHVTFEPNASWPAGDYRFEIETEAGLTTCNGALPLPQCGTPGLVCDVDSAGVQIGESGCALPASAHGFAGLQMAGAPRTVRVRVSQGPRVLLDRQLQPQYQRLEPNGPGCGPVCTSASETLRVPF